MTSLRIPLAVVSWVAVLTNLAVAADRVPVIDVTDLYHPHQDVGDNVDLITAYALPEIDLRGVVLDVTGEFRDPVTRDAAGKLLDNTGPRDPGFIPVLQLNYIFGRHVPSGVGPFRRMRSPDDTMPALPGFQESGIELMVRLLRSSRQKLDIVSFGSARPIAVAYNRHPELMRKKVRRIHLCAGATSPGFVEWNVMLDPNAMVCLLRSDLPIAIYPCATDSPFHYGRHNTFWLLPDLSFASEMDSRLQSYLAFAFGRTVRADFLRAMDEAPPVEVLEKLKRHRHKVWETAVWLEVSGRKLVRRGNGRYRIVAEDEITATDRILPGGLRPCKVTVRNDGTFSFSLTEQPTRCWIYDRGDPKLNEAALREALPVLYRSYRPGRRFERRAP